MKKQTKTKLEFPKYPENIHAFVIFFRRYMHLSTFIVAALPIPVTAFKLIPTYSVHTKILSVYTSLFCFLILAYIFYCRDKLARCMFPQIIQADKTLKIKIFRNNFLYILPAILIGISLFFLIFYHYTIEHGLPRDISARKYQLANIHPDTANSILLICLYLGIFIAAEGAFIIMAIREFMQAYLKLSDLDVIKCE